MVTKRQMVRTATAVLAVAALSFAAACGDDGGAEESSSTTTTDGAAVTEPSEGPASGEPVMVMQIVLESPDLGIFLPDAIAALQGRIDRLNEEGGVLGRPVEIEVCQAGFDPNLAAECARKAATGEYLAVLGGNFANGGDYARVLADADIANIGYVPYDPADGSAPNGYPLSGGGAASIFGAARFIADEFEPTTVAVVHTDSVAGAASLAYAKRVLEAADIQVQPVAVPRNKPDLSAEVQQAAGADAALVAASGADFAKFVGGLVQIGYDSFVVPEGLAQPAIVAALGPALDGVRAVTAWATPDMDTPGRTQYLADLAAADADQPETSAGKEAWAAGELFAQAAEKLESIDSAELLAILATISDFDAGGLMTSTDLSSPGDAMDGQPSLRRMTVLACTYEGGECLAQGGDWFDPVAP